MIYWLLLSINLLIKTICLISGITIIRKKYQLKKWRYMGGYLIVCFISEITAFLLAYYKKNNMLVFYIFIPILFVLILLFLEVSNERIRKKHISGWLSSMLVCSSIFSFYFGQSWKDPNAITSILGTIIIIAATIDTIITYSSIQSNSMDKKINIYVLYILLFYSLGTLSVWIFFGIFSPGNYPSGLHRVLFYFLYLITNMTQLSLALLLLFTYKKNYL